MSCSLTILTNRVRQKQIAPALVLPHEAKTLPTSFVMNSMNAMATTTSRQNELMIDLDQKYTILFLYNSVVQLQARGPHVARGQNF